MPLRAVRSRPRAPRTTPEVAERVSGGGVADGGIAAMLATWIQPTWGNAEAKELPPMFAGAVDPLEVAKSKVGKMGYYDSRFGRGDDHRRALTPAEIQRLVRGDADADAGSCSPFVYWALAASGYDIHQSAEVATAAGGASELSAMDILNTQAPVLERGGVGALYGGQNEEDPAIKGAAGAFEVMGWGHEVPWTEAKPRDFAQTRLAGGVQGHATLVHRVRVRGGMWLGRGPGFATLEEVHETERRLLELRGYLKPGTLQPAVGLPEEGVYVATAVYVIDEETRPENVGTHVVLSVAHLGLHDGGGVGGSGGVYTTAFAAVAHNALSVEDRGFRRTYFGRLGASIWSGWEPRDGSPVTDELFAEEEETPTEEAKGDDEVQEAEEPGWLEEVASWFGLAWAF